MSTINKYITRFALLLSFLAFSCTDISDSGHDRFEQSLVSIDTPFLYAEIQELNFDNPITYDINRINELKKQFENKPGNMPPAFNDFLSEARILLTMPPISVINRTSNIENVDLNSFLSMSTYYWPNPETESGLPYIRQDGKLNPEVDLYNRSELTELRKAVTLLSFMYGITSEEKFAQKAKSLLEAWFINPKTKMNPHLQHAQFVPGVSDGSFIGVIQGRAFVYIFDSLNLLKSSQVWDSEFESGMYNWISDFTDWLIKSPRGQLASNYYNNHSTWYDVQVAYFSRLIQNETNSLEVLNEVYSKRILTQIDENGVQIHEIKRKDGLKYSTLNLNGHILLANIISNSDESRNIFTDRYENKLESAIEYLLPSVLNPEVWPHKQVNHYSGCDFLPILNYSYNSGSNTASYSTIEQIIDQYSCDAFTILY